MKKSIVVLVLVGLLGGCAVAPSAQLQSLTTYGEMSCPQLQREYLTILEHEKYMEASRSSSNLFSVLNAGMGVALGAASVMADESGAQKAQTDAMVNSALADSGRNGAEADGYRAKKDEMTKRKLKMTQLMGAVDCTVPAIPAP